MQAQLRVRAAGEEMRGRLGLDPELRWSEVRRMKWGTELDEVRRSKKGAEPNHEQITDLAEPLNDGRF